MQALGLIGSVWADWVLYIAFPLRAPTFKRGAGWCQILVYMTFCETVQGQSPGAAFTGDFGVTTSGGMGVAVLSAATSVFAVLRKPADRLAMTAFSDMSCQEGFVGFAWGDWVLYIALSLIHI